MADRVRFHYQQGALVTDRAIADVTRPLDAHGAAYYGGDHFVAESLTERAARRLAAAFSGAWSEEPFVPNYERVTVRLVAGGSHVVHTTDVPVSYILSDKLVIVSDPLRCSRCRELFTVTEVILVDGLAVCRGRCARPGEQKALAP